MPRRRRHYELVVPSRVRTKLAVKHGISVEEAREAFERRGQPRRGRDSPRGNRTYSMYGRTYDGRPLFLAVEQNPESPDRVTLITAYPPT